MKRVVEDVTAIESQVAALYADVDAQIDRSSDSSRKTHRLIIVTIIITRRYSWLSPSSWIMKLGEPEFQFADIYQKYVT